MHAHSQLEILQKREFRATDGTPINLISTIKNEIDIIPAFLNHYRRLGVRFFYIIDNGSTDGTLEYLAAQADIFLFRCIGQYALSNAGVDWVNHIGRRYCLSQWVVTADADEFLILKNDASKTPLCELARLMQEEPAQGLYTAMVDFFAEDDGHICERYNTLKDLLERTPCVIPFSSYTSRISKYFPYLELHSDFRTALAGTADAPIRYYKIPFVFWSEDFRYFRSTHLCQPITLSTAEGLLYHFKFRPGAKIRLERELKNPGRINENAYRISQAIIKRPYEVKRMTTRLSDSDNSLVWPGCAPLQKLWTEARVMANRDLFRMLTDARPAASTDTTLRKKTDEVTQTTSWRATRRIRKYLFAKTLLPRLHYPEESKGTEEPLHQLTAIYESLWWDILMPYRILGRLARALYWRRIFSFLRGHGKS